MARLTETTWRRYCRSFYSKKDFSVSRYPLYSTFFVPGRTAGIALSSTGTSPGS